MYRLLLWPLVAALFINLVATKTALSDEGQTRSKERKPTPSAAEKKKAPRAQRPPAVERFAVAELDNELVVIKLSELAAYRKRLNDEYRAALKSYRAEKTAATAAGKSFDEPMPEKATIKQFGTSFKTEKEASARRDKIVAARQNSEASEATKNRSVKQKRILKP